MINYGKIIVKNIKKYNAIIKNKQKVIGNERIKVMNDIKEIASKNTILSICNKLKILLEYKEKIKFNVNTSLLMDKLVIAFERGE